MLKNIQFEAKRTFRILEDLEQAGSLSVTELAEKYEVSRETIRRDLLRLESDGLLRRMHGGAVRSSNRIDLEIPFTLREKRFAAQKFQIGREAAKLIQDGDTVIIDDSSTALQVAKSISQKVRVTVLTNSFSVANHFIRRNNVRTIFLGGDVRERSYSCVGPSTAQFVRSYRVDVLILGCEGISIEDGLTDSYDVEVELKTTMIAAASKTVVVVDSNKFGKAYFAKVAPIQVASVIVTDSGLPDEIRTELTRSGVTVIIAQMNDTGTISDG
jgi:DeoR/GlpR family transcriptional regulator of sugar metabolism